MRPTGVNTDIPPPELSDGEWSEVFNQSFRSGGSVRSEGYGDVQGTLLDTPLYVVGNRRPGQYFWVYPGALSISVTDQNNHFDITPAVLTSSVAGEWTGGALNDLLMLCNGLDAPMYWPGNTSDIVLPLPNFPANTIAKWIRPFKYFAIAGNITVSGTIFENQFYWSASVDPGLPPDDWTPVPGNDAGDNILAATEGALIDGYPVRDNFVLAKTHSLYLMNYVAGTFVFNINKLSVTTGVLTSNCMQEHKGLLYIFADGDIITTDGQSISSIATHRVKQTVFGEMNQDAFNVCHVALYIAKDEVWFCYPTGANTICNKAAIYNLVDQNWGFREVPQTSHVQSGITSNTTEVIDWDSDGQAWDIDATRWNQTGFSEIHDGLMMASVDDTGHLYGLDYAIDEAGQPMASYLEKTGMDFGNLEAVKLVTRLWLYAFGTAGDVLKVRIGSQAHESDPVAWSPDVDYVIGIDDKIDITIAGRLIAVRITGDNNNQWRVYSMEFEYRNQGNF